MKKYYTFGEIILTLREEYNESKKLLEELKNYIKINSYYEDYYFSGTLYYIDEFKDYTADNKIILKVEKKRLELLKKIEHLKYTWYSQFLYSADFKVDKKDNKYELNYWDVSTPIDEKKYIPKVKIINKEEFSKISDKLYSSDLMKLRRKLFWINHDGIILDFDYACINTNLGDESHITWEGNTDSFIYSIKRHNCPLLIEDILSLEIPSDRISKDWLKLLEKHENLFGNNQIYEVDVDARTKKGILKLDNIDMVRGNSCITLKKEKN